MHYELKGRHEACFKAKIGLTGLIVNSKAKNLNPMLAPQSLKSFRLSLAKSKDFEVSVVHIVDLVLHCTVHTDHLNYNKGPVAGQVNLHSTYRIWCF